MTSSPPRKNEDDDATTQRAIVLAVLWEEFHRLNRLHFDGALKLGEIRVSTRKQYGGYYNRTDSRIVVSWQAHVEHGWDETLNTFRHEVAHIVHFDHSGAFWELAERLGATRRNAKPTNARAVGQYRYLYECPVCRTRYFRQRRITRPASCGRCDRAFNPEFRLRLVKE